jgi:chromosomal replication initiation ATPase DnaA
LKGEANGLWSAVRARLARAIHTEEFDTWLAPLQLLDISDAMVVLAAPNVFVRDQIQAVYNEVLEQAVACELGRAVRVEVVIQSLVPV